MTLKKAFELAQGMEAAVKNVCEMQENPQAATRQSRCPCSESLKD